VTLNAKFGIVKNAGDNATNVVFQVSFMTSPTLSLGDDFHQTIYCSKKLARFKAKSNYFVLTKNI